MIWSTLEDGAVFAPWKPYFSSITRIVMDEGITAIGDYAFQGIYNADNTVIPSTVEVIGGRAFNAHTFDNLVIPEGVRVIEEYAFVYGEISTVSFPSTLEVVGEGVFEWTSIEKVYIPSMEDWMEIQFDDFFSTPFADYGETELYVDGVLTTQIIVPESVTEIHDSQFEFFSSLSGVQFHDGVTRIGAYAFGMSPNTGFNAENFLEVTIPASVEYIGDYAFRRCSRLGDVYILNPECAFGEDAFSDCNAYDENGNYVMNVVTIHGYAGSTAEAYAETWGYNFERLPAQEVASGWSGDTTWSLTDDGVITFSGSYNLWQLTFEGDAPSIGTSAFKGLAATAWYPADNATWTSDRMLNYGGTITWMAR